jgi:hypothetical protein
MPGSTVSPPTRPLAPRRRLILGTALALALVVWLAPKTPVAGAQEARPAAEAAATAAPKPAAGGDGRGVSINIGIKGDADAATADQARDRPDATAKDGKSSADAHVKDEKDPATGRRTITVVKNGKTVTVTGIPGDREFDSFSEIVHTEPELAIMIIAIVAVVFLAPVLAIALILGYRMRKARMQNETMLKLAEKGVVGPAEAIEAVAAGTVPARLRPDGAAGSAGGGTAPVERAKQIRERAAWSDLRKGIVMGAIGLGLSLFSVLDDGTPNSLGLVLLFVGIGYGVLWWFEERQIAPRNGGSGPSPGAGPGGAA